MLTFVIPVSSYHEAIVERAIASIHAQTIRCAYVVIHDRDRRGAGWARNEGLKRVKTPFISFLDADDWLEPEFAEACLRAYDGAHYIYTDWMVDNRVVEAPDQAWNLNGAAHLLTTLLPTALVKHIGGFDETLPGGEDTAFYWKLTRAGLWGKRLASPLFHYGKEGKRSQAFMQHPDFKKIMESVVAPYRGLPMSEDCNGCGGTPNTPSVEGQQPGDVLAETLWQGNRPERGRATGRIYYGGWNSRLWVAAQDIDATPHLFSRVVEMPPPISAETIRSLRQTEAQKQAPQTVDEPQDFGAMVNRIRQAQRDVQVFGTGKPSPAPAPLPPPVITAQQGVPNIRRIMQLYQPQ